MKNYYFTWWTNTSEPPSMGVMNPHPLATLNHLHLPRLLFPVRFPFMLFPLTVSCPPPVVPVQLYRFIAIKQKEEKMKEEEDEGKGRRRRRMRWGQETHCVCVTKFLVLSLFSWVECIFYCSLVYLRLYFFVPFLSFVSFLSPEKQDTNEIVMKVPVFLRSSVSWEVKTDLSLTVDDEDSN